MGLEYREVASVLAQRCSERGIMPISYFGGAATSPQWWAAAPPDRFTFFMISVTGIISPAKIAALQNTSR